MSSSVDVAVVGAGPYGLSAAANLMAKGLTVAVFGKPLGMWRDRMPGGMLLRSQWWATHLSDPREDRGFAQFVAKSKYKLGYPMPAQAFIDYGLWFQKVAVPQVEDVQVSAIEKRDGRFRLTLADGRKLDSGAVVMAIGLYPYANRPEQFAGFPKEKISHSSDVNDYSRFKGQDVIVVGGGQSAIEYAALLHEAGARVQVVARRPIVWLDPDRANERGFWEKLLAPNASVAAGWFNWVLDHFPYLFYCFSQYRKDRYTSGYHSGACDWLRHRVIGKVTLHEGQTITKVTAKEGRLEAVLSGGKILNADHIMLATGYKVDVDQLDMVHPSLRGEIKSDKGVPVLSHYFESSVPGLYFIGATSLRAFGPLYRFVAGAPASARRVAGVIARRNK